MIIIVTGMHRSGTSAAAGLLHRNGILMGRESHLQIGTSPENLKGFYENKKFRGVNNAILLANNYNVLSWDPHIPCVIEVPPKVKNRMVQILNMYINNSFWGWKDPRTCLTLAVWSDILEQRNLDYKVVTMYRDPIDIATSLMKRRNCNLDIGVKLATTYYNRLQSSLDKISNKSIVVHYNDLCDHTSNVTEALSSFLGVSISDTSFVDAKLRTNWRKNL